MSRKDWEQLRLQAVPDLRSDATHAALARKYEVTEMTIMKWRKRLAEDGVDGLRDRREKKGRRPPGRPPGAPSRRGFRIS